MQLVKNTAIGGVDYVMGLPWLKMRESVFKLVESGEIRVHYEGCVPKVDLGDLKTIEVCNHYHIKPIFRSNWVNRTEEH